MSQSLRQNQPKAAQHLRPCRPQRPRPRSGARCPDRRRHAQERTGRLMADMEHPNDRTGAAVTDGTAPATAWNRVVSWAEGSPRVTMTDRRHPLNGTLTARRSAWLISRRPPRSGAHPAVEQLVILLLGHQRGVGVIGLTHPLFDDGTQLLRQLISDRGGLAEGDRVGAARS